MNSDTDINRNPNRFLWMGAGALGLAVVGYGVVNYQEVADAIARIRSVETLDSVETVDVAPEMQVAEVPDPVQGDPKPTAQPEPTSEPEPTPAATAGSGLFFDIVRVESDGTTLVAGRANPGGKVSVVIDGIAQSEVEADASGSFVVFLDLVDSDEPRTMWLMAETDDGSMVMSESSIILAPRANPAGTDTLTASALGAPVPSGVAASLARPGDQEVSGLASEPPPGGLVPENTASLDTLPPVPADEDDTFDVAALVQSGAPDVTENPVVAPQIEVALEKPAEAVDVVTTAGAPQAPAINQPNEALQIASVQPEIAAATASLEADKDTPRVLVNDLDGVRVLDAPRLADPADLRLDTISYGAEGAVLLRGRTGPRGKIRVRLSGAVAGETQAGDDGLWLERMTGIAAGDYTLQIERLDDAGDVLSTVSLPFRRESPNRLAEALGTQSIQVVTVQPGATLWAIARENYGDGAQYVQVFEANKSQISNPDLIYPGQVFGLPQDQVGAE